MKPVLVMAAEEEGGRLSETRLNAFAWRQRALIINATQCPGGATKMRLNEIGRLASDPDVIRTDPSAEAISTKLMWLLRKGIPYENLLGLMHTELTGELGVREESA